MTDPAPDWPAAPTPWSHSAYRIARECPRQWALLTAGASTVGGGSAGAAPLVARVRGRTCHGVLEEMFRLHRERGGPPFGSSAMIRFWRENIPQGLLALAREVMASEVSAAARSAAVDVSAANDLSRACDGERPTIVSYVKAGFRVVLGSIADSTATLTPELPINARLGLSAWTGRIDLVVESAKVLAFLDFKTGRGSATDREQLELYALLHARDAEANPAGRLVTRLVLLYPQGEVIAWDAPKERELIDLERRIGADVDRIAADLSSRPPVALTDGERCAKCAVRVHCDDYWRKDARDVGRGQGDVRVRVERVAGAEVVGMNLDTGRRVVVLSRGRLPGVPRAGSILRVAGARALGDAVDGDAAEVLEVVGASVGVQPT